MSEDCFVQHCTRGIFLARRTPKVIDPIIETFDEGIKECSNQLSADYDPETVEELRRMKQALLDYVQDVAEVIADLTSDYVALMQKGTNAC